MAITSLPTPPSRSDPENFPERADAFMAALPRFATEANALQEHVNEAAATVGQDANAAALSRDAAAESRSQAGQSAQAAETARQTAAQKAGEAGASAQLAQKWAEKMGAPVEGDGFSAKHWAEVAARGAGLPVYMPDSVPVQDVGPIFIVRQGNAEWDAATGRYRVHSNIPVGAVAWWPLRASITAGRIPADGQTISRATFPDLVAMVVAGTVPVVPEADWLANPLKRGCYTLGDGSTTIRVPDYNGRAPGSIGALFLRGDGALSSGTNGTAQRDALQNITGTFDIGWGALKGRLAMDPAQQVSGPLRYNLGPGDGRVINSDVRTGFNDYIQGYTFDASLVARTATESRPSNVSGVWTIQAFGAVTNPGAADAAQLASDYAVLNAAVQTLAGEFGFIVLYPGGNAATPGIIPANTQMVVDNPFAGYAVHVEVEHRIDQQWFNPGWYCMLDRSSSDPYFAWGIQASHNIQTDKIVVSAGKTGTATINQALSGGSYSGAMPTNQTNAYFRLKVWKLKGKP